MQTKAESARRACQADGTEASCKASAEGVPARPPPRPAGCCNSTGPRQRPPTCPHVTALHCQARVAGQSWAKGISDLGSDIPSSQQLFVSLRPAAAYPCAVPGAAKRRCILPQSSPDIYRGSSVRVSVLVSVVGYASTGVRPTQRRTKGLAAVANLCHLGAFTNPPIRASCCSEQGQDYPSGKHFSDIQVVPSSFESLPAPLPLAGLLKLEQQGLPCRTRHMRLCC